MSTVFLSDWRFWSFVASITAIILSQLPPIKQLVKKSKLDIELYSRIHITHKVGNPTLTAHIIIRNTGGKKVRVKEVNLELERDGQSICNLKAQNYYPDPKTNQGVILTPFSLNPDDEWSNSVLDIKIKSKFIIFESQFDDLSEYKEQYSTGAGIYWDNSEQTGIFIELDNVTSIQE
jgi:hypothetical protein